MRLHDLSTTALKGVTRNRSRALLTMLGIIIGVGAVVLMTSVGKSMESVILGQISVLGPKTIALWPGKNGPEQGAATLNPDFDSLKISDVEALKRLQTVTNISPIIFMEGKTTYGTEQTDTRVGGTTPETYTNQVVTIAEGRFHDAQDELEGRFVAVLGTDTARDLFSNQSPIGKRIGIGDHKYTVIGVLAPVGSQFFQNMDERVIIPFHTAHIVSQRTYVDMVTMQSTGDSADAIDDIQWLLRRRHKIVPPTTGVPTDNDDFLVRSAAQAQEILGTVSISLTLFITMIAAISLLVGGIGIMNIMLVAVTERTREIGLRKALGAQGRDILLQFLIEAVALTFLGGLVGLAAGLGVNALIVGIAKRFLENYVFAVNPIAIVASLLMAAGTGLAFGIYPARKASRLNPIEALRYE
ncbi:MAG: ABC transporter permease [Candidatus Peribacteraceae bacterium]|nr:ABC transporter permease [Candidatus Peribacteraceae bacterium]